MSDVKIILRMKVMLPKGTMFIKCKCNNEEDNMIQGQCFHTDDESNVDICEKDYVNNGALAVKQHLQMEREDFS